ncbi:hypothetical protein [Rhodococcus sp. Q]|uniref:hypothetical protein n=1 Tax=Rhodococcus sp. Q TaxID=2502252 RepID=UPI0010F8981D|nr:hypothetical protein [Rhodococcus sp. Q]
MTAQLSGAERTIPRMATYGLWQSVKHFMVSNNPPCYESDSIGELDSIGRNKGWYSPAPAVIAQRNATDSWVPESWVRKTHLVNLTPDQPIKYQQVREGLRPWPNHLGEPPSSPAGR